MTDVERDRLTTVFDRVAAMADEVGEAAIYSVTEDRAWLDAMANAHERALQTYLQFPDRFRHAEEGRYTDERRRGRMWDGFKGPERHTLRRDATALDAFKADIQTHFHSPHVHIHIFDRHRQTFEGDDRALIQATVYREGRPDDFLEFVEGTLDRRPRRPDIPEHLWEMGDVQLPGRRHRVPLWIARRLTDRAVWTAFTEALRKRPAPGLRIVLSLTPTDRLEKDIHLGHSIVALHDVALAAEARTHQGRWCFGKTPMQTFLDSRPLAREKQQIGEAA